MAGDASPPWIQIHIIPFTFCLSPSTFTSSCHNSVTFIEPIPGKMATSKSVAKPAAIDKGTLAYNKTQLKSDKAICDLLAQEISQHLPEAENKIWHRHPVWFLEGNPIVGYSKLKDCIRLLFWSGQSFEEKGLADEGSFKAAEARYTSVGEVNTKDLKRWLGKARKIQWDYKNIVKRRGVLEKLVWPKTSQGK